MTRTSEPRPSGKKAKWTPILWPVIWKLSLPTLVIAPQSRFADVMRLRRSERHLDRTSLRRVTEILAFATQPLSSWSSAGLPRQSSPTAASGGLHGIELLVAPSPTMQRLFRFAASENSLDRLDAQRDAIAALEQRCNACLPNAASASTIFLVADRRKYEAAYIHPESLIWRDAGALLQSLSLTATAFGLGSCILGIHGNEIGQALPGIAAQLQPCGIIKVGTVLPVLSGNQ
jgi:nitroreductase